MSSAETRRRARRGLLVLLDGLVITVLAAVITVRSSGTGITDLASATVGVLSTWVATPGVGTMEAIAYAGFAVAMLGPLWFWGIRSFVSPVSLKTLLPSRDSSPEELEFAQQASTVDRRDERGQISDGGDVFRTVLADELQSSGPDWTEKVFGESAGPTMAVPEGDFLRGGGGFDPKEPERRRRSLRATFGPPEDGEAARSVDIHESPETSEPDQATTATVVKASHESSTSQPSSTPSDEEPKLDEALLEAFGVEQTASAEPPAKTDAAEDEPTDPLERLGEQLSESRAQIGTVDNRLSEATAPNGVETARAALVDRTAEDDDPTSQLEVAFARRNFEMGEAIAELRADQATIESAFEAVSHGS